MRLKLKPEEKMLFRRGVPNSDLNCTTDIWQIYLYVSSRPLKQK